VPTAPLPASLRETIMRIIDVVLAGALLMLALLFAAPFERGAERVLGPEAPSVAPATDPERPHGGRLLWLRTPVLHAAR
jgi:hypothetical protein